MSSLPVILHIPHASVFIPADELDLYCVGQDRLRQENLRLADLHTDDLYHLDGAGRAVFPISRFCVDAERFSDDTQEPMAARGMGVLYTVGTDLSVIRPHIPESRRTALLEKYYWPHHNLLDQMAADCIAEHGYCLIFDCHSYPSRPLPYELENRDLLRPPIGVGTDRFHTPVLLRDNIAAAFREKGYETGIDTPFSGSLVPNAFYGKDKRVMSVMMEIRKDLYMDEETGARNVRFSRVQEDVAAIMAAIVAQLPEIADQNR